MLIQFCHLITVYHFKQLLTIFICTYFISTYAANLRIVVYYIYLRNFCGIVKFSYCCTLFYASLYPIVLLYLSRSVPGFPVHLPATLSSPH